MFSYCFGLLKVCLSPIEDTPLSSICSQLARVLIREPPGKTLLQLSIQKYKRRARDREGFPVPPWTISQQVRGRRWAPLNPLGTRPNRSSGVGRRNTSAPPMVIGSKDIIFTRPSLVKFSEYQDHVT